MKRKFLLTIGLFITILCLSGCKGETYTVNYVLNDGINDEKNVSNYNEGDLPINLYNPSKENYEFIGWYLDEEFTKNSINEIATGQKGITLYAKWAINEATVSFVSNGGSLIDAIRAGTHTHTYTDGYTSHIVLISGNVENVTISTSHILLYTILQ